MSTFNIAIIGTSAETAGFAAVGVHAIVVASAAEALSELTTVRNNLRSKTGEQYAIVFIMEDLIKQIPQEEYDKLTKEALPAIIPLPGHGGATGFGDEKLRRIVEKAVGSDIFS